jgi:ligand-binding SRPBCC domain-containing protein
MRRQVEGEYVLMHHQVIPLPLGTVFSFFESPRNLERITPDNLGFRIIDGADEPVHEGSIINYIITWKGIPMRWRTIISAYDPPHTFVDEQLRGPYALWHHTHEFREVDGGVEMTDTVRYKLPFGFIGRIVHALIVRKQVERIFEYRRGVILAMIEDHAAGRSFGKPDCENGAKQ